MANVFYRLAQLFSEDARKEAMTAKECINEKKKSKENWARIQLETKELQEFGQLKHLFNEQKPMSNEQLEYLNELSNKYFGGRPRAENNFENRPA